MKRRLATIGLAAALLIVAEGHAAETGQPDADLIAQAAIVVEGDVAKVTVTSGVLDRYGMQPGTMMVVLIVRATEKGTAIIGAPLAFEGETILRAGDLEGPISAIPPTLRVGNRVRVALVRDGDHLVVPSWRAFRLVEAAGQRFPPPKP